jgi:hypothetical protein
MVSCAILLQYYLANVPVPIDLEDHEEFRTARASLAHEAVILRDCMVNSPDRSLLDYAGNDQEVVNVYFDKARLGGETLSLLTVLGLEPPPSAAPLDYVTPEPERIPTGATCRTSIGLKLEDTGRRGELQFFQLGQPGLHRSRRIEMRTIGSGLTVNLITSAPEHQSDGPGCRKLLQIDDWSSPVRGLGVQVQAEANSSFRFSFLPAAPGSGSWKDAQGVFESLLLDSVGAREVAVRRIREDGQPIERPSLHLRSDGDSYLKVKSLELGSDFVQMSIAGKAWVTKDGKTVGFNLMDALRQNLMLAALLTALNGALLALAAKLFLGRRPATETRQRQTSATDAAT